MFLYQIFIQTLHPGELMICLSVTFSEKDVREFFLTAAHKWMFGDVP